MFSDYTLWVYNFTLSMKIAVFTDTFYPMVNWVVTSTLTFIQKLAQRWHEIMVFCPYNKWVENYKYQNIKIVYLRWVPALFYPEFKLTVFQTTKVYRNFRKFNPDIIHFHTQFNIWLKGLIFWKTFGIPIVWTYHTKIADQEYLKNLKLNNLKFVETLARSYNNFFYKYADKVLTPSLESKKELIKHWIKKNEITVLENPLPIIEKPEIKKFFLKDLTSQAILYVWRISKEKNLDITLNVFKKINEKKPDVKFVLVWDGPYFTWLQRTAKKLGISDSIILLGMIPHDDLINSDIFSKTSMFLTCSTSETQWITVLEANYFGLPVVWVNKWWLNELIKNNSNWYKASVESVDRLAFYCLKILNDSELQKSLSQNAKDFTQKFDPEILTDKLENIYFSLQKKKELPSKKIPKLRLTSY